MIRATGILLLRKDGALLLQHRDNKKSITHPNMWGSPGGHVNPNETYLKCAIRELFEETGYTNKNLNYLSTFVEPSKHGLMKVKLYWELYDNIQAINCYEGQSIRFVLPEEAEKMNIVQVINVAWKKILKFL